MRKFISEMALENYYHNALCLEDKSKVNLKNNWFD